MSNIIEKAIMPYNTSNKIIHNNKYHLFAPAASTGRIGMAGFNTSQFTINNQIVSLNDTVVRVIDINDVPDDITYDGVDGIKTAGVMYKNYTREVIDVIVDDVPSYITVTGTLLVTSSSSGINEMFMAEGRIWTRELVEGAPVSYFMSLEAIITSQLGEHEIASQAEAVAGEVNNKYMTPLRTKQALASNYYDKAETDSLISTINKPAKVFDDLTALLADLDLETEYEIGTSFYLREMTQFDFWYTGVAEDDTEVAWYGYKISPLEAKTDLTDYVEKEAGKELIPTADLQKLQATDPFDEGGTYPDLTAGKAYNVESQTPYALDEAFDLRVTASEDVEVKDGLAKVKELQAVVTRDGNGIITDRTSKPTLLITTNDNLLEFLETYENTSYGVKVEIIENGVVRIYGTATDDIALETHRLSKYFGIANHYDASAILYATVIAGEIPAAADIYFNDIIDSGITDGIVGTNASVTLAGATKYINQLEISLDIPDTTEIDVTIRFYTKHASNPDQTFVIPITSEKTLYTSELTEDDWFQDNVINYETKQFTKYWRKYVLDGSEAWEFYSFANGKYCHFLPITEELTELASTTLIAQGRVGTATPRLGGMMWAQGSLDGINGIIVVTSVDLATYKTIIGTNNLTIWVKFLTPTIRQLTTIVNEILYPAYNYGLEFGLLHNKLKVEYSSDFQKQITTNLENIIELKATKAETYETSVVIDTTDWVADGVTASYKAVKAVSGVLASDNPIIAFDLSGIADTDWNAHRTEFAKIGLASTTNDNEITFYASATPTEDITVIVKVVR